MNNMTIATILKGCTPGKMQSVGYMKIIPLISDFVDNSIKTPNEIEASTLDYGKLCLENKSNMSTIFPVGGAIVSKQKAQNHTSPKG